MLGPLLVPLLVLLSPIDGYHQLDSTSKALKVNFTVLIACSEYSVNGALFIKDIINDDHLLRFYGYCGVCWLCKFQTIWLSLHVIILARSNKN